MKPSGNVRYFAMCAAAAAVIAGISIQGCDDSPHQVAATTSTPMQAATVTVSRAPYYNPKTSTAPPTPAGPASTISRAGTYLVGSDIRPGTWRTTGAAGCYWARLSNLTGEISGIIANGGSDGQEIVQVLPSDKAFQVTRCTSWTLIPD